MRRFAWSKIIAVSCLSSAASVVYTLTLWVSSGGKSGFLSLAIVGAAGLGVVGGAAGFSAAQLVNASSLAKVISGSIAAFFFTAALGHLPGLVRGWEFAVVVGAAVAIVFITLTGPTQRGNALNPRE